VPSNAFSTRALRLKYCGLPALIVASLVMLQLLPRAFAEPLVRPPAPALPKLSVLPELRGTIDPAALARRYEEARKQGSAARAPVNPALIVFVSLSMPESSLKSILDQSARAPAVVKLRGVADGSMRKTLERIKALIGDRDVAFEIDPDAFRRYGVASVPAVVLASPAALAARCSEASCLAPASFAIVRGDVTLDHALDLIERQDTAFAPIARGYYRRIRGTTP
jgi:conjugal transfer pilus assembly protein TrbC